MVTLNRVSKIYGVKTVLRDISFSIKKGEIIGFLGPNGAGKTTTMRIIVGYISPTYGEVFIEGKNPIYEREETLSFIGYLPENNPLYQSMKVKEYLSFIRECKGADKEEEEKVIFQTGLYEQKDELIEELSRGNRQRVGLAAALIGDPKLIVLDEPTSGLDPIEQEKIRALIKSLGKNKTIILSTHILSEAEDVATRIIIIDKGSIVYDGAKPKGKDSLKKLFTRCVQI